MNIAQRRKNLASQFPGEVHFPAHAVTEPQPDDVVANMTCLDNVEKLTREAEWIAAVLPRST
jgi:hypothetical protein